MVNLTFLFALLSSSVLLTTELLAFRLPDTLSLTRQNRLGLSNKNGCAAPHMVSKSKAIITSDECRNNLLKGVKQVADVVKVTLGPQGRNILIEKEYGNPLIVNDGVTITRNIELDNKFREQGAQLIKQVARSSDDKAGDGTTSSTILAAELCEKGIKYVNQGHNPIPIEKGIRACVKLLMEEVQRLSIPVDGYKDLLNVATVATSGDLQMGQNIARSFEKLGKNAAIVLEDNPALEDELEFTEGYTFDRGWANPFFLVNEDKDAIEWTSPRFLVCDHKLENIQALFPVLEQFSKTKESLVIIAEDFGTEAMQTLLINKMKGVLKVIAVRAPSFGERRKEYLRDISICTNSTLISKELGMSLEDVTPVMLGTSKAVVIKKERTSILTDPRFKPEIEERIALLELEATKSTSKFEREKLLERLAALSGGIARIMIGASTETEQKEKRMRYEDALNAVRAALETGYVPGGGVTYLALTKEAFANKVIAQVEAEARKSLSAVDEDTGENYLENDGAEEMESEIALQKAGARLVFNVLPSITKQIAVNAGVNGDRIVSTIMNSGRELGFGWNAKTNTFGNLIKQGVIDPVKVVNSALEHASSIARLLLTTEAMMVNKPEQYNNRNKDFQSQPPIDME